MVSMDEFEDSMDGVKMVDTSTRRQDCAENTWNTICSCYNFVGGFIKSVMGMVYRDMGTDERGTERRLFGKLLVKHCEINVS